MLVRVLPQYWCAPKSIKIRYKKIREIVVVNFDFTRKITHSKTHKILTLVIEISELLMNTYKVPQMCLDVGN